jgi:hypothetical protein
MADVNETLAQRGGRYGDFREHARVAQNLKQALMDSTNWGLMPAYLREGFDMICHKMARALSGDWTYADNIHDMVGYAKLMEDRLAQDSDDTTIEPPLVIDMNYPLSDYQVDRLLLALTVRGIRFQDLRGDQSGGVSASGS